MMYISSINNDIVREKVKLKVKKYRDITNTYLIEGEHLVSEAINSGVIECVFILKDYSFDMPSNIVKYEVSYEILKRLSDNVSTPKIIGVCKKQESDKIDSRVLLLDRLQDPGNLGTIIRSAVAFNFDTIILSDESVDLYNSKVIRSTQGMMFKINIIRRNIIEVIDKLKKDNYLILGTDVINGVEVSSVNIKDKYALVIGNEGQGISDEVKSLCDKMLYINMNSNCESLNASVAASILMYELGGK